MRGSVKWFNEQKGYGFILGEDGKEIFAHYSEIKSEANYKTLQEGDEVSFDVTEGDKGLRATSIEVQK